MGLSHVRPFSLLLIVVLAILLLGGKRIRNLGEDLALSIKSFRRAIKEPENQAEVIASESSPKDV